MWIFCGGMFQSASTLQYQIASDIVEAKKLGRRVTWHDPEEFSELEKNYVDYTGYLVFKAHTCTEDMEKLCQNGFGKVIYIYRDMRDVVVSYMQKYEISFQKVMEIGIIEKSIENYLKWTSFNNVYISCYEKVVSDIAAEVTYIAKYLNINIGLDLIDDIAKKYTIEKQRKRILEIDSGVENVTKSKKKFDPHTLLHRKHIRDGKVGKWKSVLTEEQRQVIEDKCRDWLMGNGYI